MNVYQAAVLLLLVAAVLGGIGLTVNGLQVPEGSPQWASDVLFGLKYVFLTSAVAPLFVVIRNIYGYYENKAVNPNMQFEAKQLLATWLKYEAYIKGAGLVIVVVAAGTNLQSSAYIISGSVAFIIDLIRKSLSDLAGNKTATPLVTPPTTPAPT